MPKKMMLSDAQVEQRKQLLAMVVAAMDFADQIADDDVDDGFEECGESEYDARNKLSDALYIFEQVLHEDEMRKLDDEDEDEDEDDEPVAVQPMYVVEYDEEDWADNKAFMERYNKRLGK